MDSKDKLTGMEKLTAETYHSWKFEMHMFLLGKDLWEIVDGKEKEEDYETEADKKSFRKRANQALSKISLAVFGKSICMDLHIRANAFIFF